MLQKILKLYVMAMAGKVHSPVPHLFGPPGCGKSTVAKQAADALGVTLHTINVSRISPLELEGVQMPNEGNTKLKLLTATFWTQLKDGDILLLDEFLRGFPEVYNGLLDILTSREVAGFKLPNVFILAASNSTVAYDKALEDRLLHLPVADPRKRRSERERLAKLFVEELGLLPRMSNSAEVSDLFYREVLPMYELLDQLGSKATLGAAAVSGTSLRNLIGQVKLREIRSTDLRAVIDANNAAAHTERKPQFFVFTSTPIPERWVAAFEAFAKSVAEDETLRQKLTPIQLLNLQLNQQMLNLALVLKADYEEEKEETEDEEFFS